MSQPLVPWRSLSSPEASQGDAESAFDALVRAHYGRLCNFAFRLVRSRETAEDIVQDVFARVWHRREEFDIRDPLPYLYQAIRNRVTMHARRQRVHERWWQSAACKADRDRPDAGGELECAELAQALSLAVEALPDRCRLIFTMSREQDLTYLEIARVLGISVKTVETQMGRALKTLRTRLAGYLGAAAALLTSVS
jgi:RNA polymerase sigma-70 factor (ECF subfamily)